MKLPIKLLTIILFPIAISTSAQEMLNNSLLYFTENKGQVTDQHYTTRNDIDLKLSGTGLNVYIGKGQLHYQFMSLAESKGSQDKKAVSTYRMDIELLGSNQAAQLVLEDMLPYYERHYTTGCGVDGIIAHSYQKATYKNVYPGIDWIIYIKDGQLEHDFAVHENADVSQIKLRYGGAASLRVNADGSLTATTPMGTVTETSPYSYQAEDKKSIASSFRVTDDILSFEVAPHTGTIVIDPSIVWSTYYHGATNGIVMFRDMAVSGAETIYMTGHSSADNIATNGAYQQVLAGNSDAILVKFDSAGNRIWATYYGGIGEDISAAIACDNVSNIYIAGSTQSPTGMATPGSHQLTYGDSTDAFLAKFDSSGQRVWSTYYGGDSSENGWGLCLTGSGHLYISGDASSTTHIATVNAFQPSNGGSNDAFLAKFDTAGHRVWATYYGGAQQDESRGCNADDGGNVYICGSTFSTNNISTPGSHQPFKDTHFDGFLAKFDSAGNRIWGTYYGGGQPDLCETVITDEAGNVYAGGVTGRHYLYPPSNTGIATPGSYQPNPGGGTGDGFLVKFDSSGVRQWGTYIGGAEYDHIAHNALHLGDLQTLYFGGLTISPNNISTTGAWQQAYGGGLLGDGFVGKVDSAGTVQWVSYFGGNEEDGVFVCGFDGVSNVYIAGKTLSTTGISTPGAFQTTYGGFAEGFLAKIDDCVTPAQPSAILGDTIVCPGSSFTLSTPAVTGAVSYTWSLPVGWSGNSTTDSINITAGTIGGTVSVTAHSNCASGIAQTMSINVYPAPIVIITQTGNTLDAGTFASYQWYINGNAIPGATQQTYTVTQPGSYTVMVTDTNGCTAMSAPLALSTENLSAANDVNIYPSPTDGRVYIQGINTPATVTVTNAIGQVVYSQYVKGKGTITIDLSKEASGIYLVEITCGNVIVRKKVLKK